jgi:hypothetical protein
MELVAGAVQIQFEETRELLGLCRFSFSLCRFSLNTFHVIGCGMMITWSGLAST